MADKTIFSDCLDKLKTASETLKPFVYLSKLHKKTLSFLKGLVVAGTGFFPPRCFGKFQERNSPTKPCGANTALFFHLCEN